MNNRHTRLALRHRWQILYFQTLDSQITLSIKYQIHYFFTTINVISPANPNEIPAAINPTPKLKCILNQVNISALKNPPMLPTEFINAIPAAAAVPVSTMAGRDQKMESAHIKLVVAIEIENKIKKALVASSPLAMKANIPTKHATATCHLRSPFRSECLEYSIIPSAAHAHGIDA